MGCFLACFGLKKKKKPRKPGKKTSPSGQQDHRSYVPLHSHVSNTLDLQENFTSDSNHLRLRDKVKEKIKKKVSFNLNVMAYEPIPHDHDDEEDDDLGKYLCEGAKWEFNTVENNVIASSHRYQNCRDSYDDEDNEFDFEEIEDNYYDDDDEDEEFVDVYSSIEEDVINNQTEVKRFEHDSNVRDRRQYVLSVLNPVENISQWRQVKAKTSAIPPLKMCEKENIN